MPGGDPRPASRRRRTSSASRPPVREQAHGSEAEVPTQEVELQQEGDRKTRIVDIAVPAAVKRAARDKQPVQRRKAANQSADSEQHSVLDDVGHRIKRGYLRIPPMDRLSMWSLGLCFVGAFLPWRYLDGGVMLSGIEGYGLASAFASALALFLLYLRSTVRRLRGLLINVQLLANAASVAAPLYALVSIPNYNWAIGLPLTGVAGMAAMAFTLIRIARVGGS